MGEVNVDEMLGKISSTQLTEWMEYDRTIEPFGEWRADYRIGQVCSLIFNTNVDLQKNKPAVPSDFILKMEKHKPKKLDVKTLTNKILSAFGVGK